MNGLGTGVKYPVSPAASIILEDSGVETVEATEPVIRIQASPAGARARTVAIRTVKQAKVDILGRSAYEIAKATLPTRRTPFVIV